MGQMKSSEVHIIYFFKEFVKQQFMILGREGGRTLKTRKPLQINDFSYWNSKYTPHLSNIQVSKEFIYSK